MIIDILKEILNELGISENSLLHVFETGSQIFIDSPNDKDYFVICNTSKIKRKLISKYLDGVKLDFFIVSRGELRKQLTFSSEIEFPTIRVFNYFHNLMGKTLYGQVTHSWDMLKYKEAYLKYIQEIYFPSIGQVKNKINISKSFIHYYIILKIYDNNSVSITEQMRDDIKTLSIKGNGADDVISWVDSQMNQIK